MNEEELNEIVSDKEKLQEFLNEGERILEDSTKKALFFQNLKIAHIMSEEFLKKENPTMDEYNEIINYFDMAMEYVKDECHLYFEEIYFIIETNISTPLITVEDIDKLVLLYDVFMNKAIQVAKPDERIQLEEMYQADKQNIRNMVIDRRNNYPTTHEQITCIQCTNCLRTVPINSEYCKHCGKEI